MQLSSKLSRASYSTILIVLFVAGFMAGLTQSSVCIAAVSAFLYAEAISSGGERYTFQHKAVAFGALILGVMLGNIALNWSDFLAGFQEGFASAGLHG